MSGYMGSIIKFSWQPLNADETTQVNVLGCFSSLHFDHFLSKQTKNLSSFPPISIEGMWSSNEYGRSMSPDINMCPPHCPWCHTQGPKVYLVLLDAQTAKGAMCRKSFRSLGLFLTLSQSVNWYGSRRWHQHQHVSCITLPLMSHLGSKGVFDAPECTDTFNW